MSKTKLIEILESLETRFGLPRWDASDWSSTKIEGGIAMNAGAVEALGETARMFGDVSASVLEMETTGKDFPVLQIKLDYPSFRSLKGQKLSHFELVLLPESRNWLVLLTIDLETYVFGAQSFIDALSKRLETVEPRRGQGSD